MMGFKVKQRWGHASIYKATETLEPDIVAKTVKSRVMHQSFTGNFVTPGHLLHEQSPGICSAPGCTQPLYILRAIGRYRVLVRPCMVEIDKWAMCAHLLCLMLDLYTCESQISLAKHASEKKNRNTHCFEKPFSSGCDGLVISCIAPYDI